jgi:uncharacterized membrane protein
MQAAPRNLAYLCLFLSLLAIVGVALSHLSLTDIAHGEPDLSGEWTTLRFSALIFLGLSVTSLVFSWQVISRWGRSGAPLE